jgi:hypothetical protein
MSKVHLGRSPEQVPRTSQDGKKKRNSLLESLKPDTGGSKDKGRQTKRLSASQPDLWRQPPPPLVTEPRAAQTKRIPNKLLRGSVPQDASADGTKRRSFPKLLVRDFHQLGLNPADIRMLRHCSIVRGHRQNLQSLNFLRK